MEREIERGIHVVGARVVPAAGHVPVGTHDKGGAVAWAVKVGQVGSRRHGRRRPCGYARQGVVDTIGRRPLSAWKCRADVAQITAAAMIGAGQLA
ncbi:MULTISPECIES: hypothetical protein [Burkholderia]|uniref:Uncharacterized protein n=1 Tax=Burkholderia sola TaxID=2843302 RepID=A0ABV2CB35_9BURK|nr:hypothetical protein [Burkholderia sp. CpTa8-5]MBP0608307.1 hypothetical protein [Burkholderia sp. CpTa8-5]